MLNTGKISSELADVRPDSRESMYLPASRADRLLAATPSGSIICVTAFGSSEETSYRVACLVVAAVGVVQGCSKHLFEGDCVILEIVAGIRAMLPPVMRNQALHSPASSGDGQFIISHATPTFVPVNHGAAPRLQNHGSVQPCRLKRRSGHIFTNYWTCRTDSRNKLETVMDLSGVATETKRALWMLWFPQC